MAGLGRKDFQAGAVLSAADVDGYLMDQTVMKFANTSAAGSAYGTAISEGMNFYLSDTDEVVFHNGTTFAKQKPTTNAVINGAFDFNQRGFTSATTAGYGLDRFTLAIGGDGTATYSAQTFTLGAEPEPSVGAKNYARIVTTGQTSTATATSLRHNIENVRTFAGKTVTLSFWARSGSGTPKIAAEIYQNFGPGGSAFLPTYAGQQTINTTWTRYSFTVTVPSLSGKTIGDESNALGVVIWVSAGSTLDSRTGSIGIQSNTFDIWGVQLEAGSVATPFSRAGGTLQGELAACQRYYYKAPATGGGGVFSGNITSGSVYYNCSVFPVTMRIAPTCEVSVYGSTGFSTASVNATSTNNAYVQSSATSTGVGYFTYDLTASSEL